MTYLEKTMFVVCGEALMDVFPVADTPTGVSLDARVGGSPLNVAVGLARLEQPVAFLSGISAGALGTRLVKALADEGVDLSCVQRLPSPTTLSLVALDERGVPDYAFYGTGAADRQLPMAALDQLPASRKAIHIGSYATVVEPVATTLRALIEREYSTRVISYDPNIRLNVEPDLAPWHRMLEWMLPRTHVFKVSEEDLGLLFPGEALPAIAARFLAAGAALVVITRGGDGALGFTKNAQVEAAPVKVKVIDTVGAGDTFQAALLTWLAENDRLTPAGVASLDEASLSAALAFAAQAAAITCSRRGADLPRRAELE